jgi:GDPmannose 4,6-dehydratase
MKRSLLVGAHGQDGRLLQARLAREQIPCLALGRGDIDLTNPAAIRTLLSGDIDRVYYLAAHHHSSQDSAPCDLADLYRKSMQVHADGLFHFLEAIRSDSPQTRLFYAASSLVFGAPTSEPQNEFTPLNPSCIYGITKACGIQLCRYFRSAHGVFASAGFLFNHESPLRERKFVIPKIIQTALAIAGGSAQKLHLGELAARVDWGYAPDFVDAMVRILNLEEADDFVIASGQTHAVQEVVEIVFAHLGLNWRDHVLESPAILTRKRVALRGDSSKLREQTGWRPSVDFQTMIHRLVAAAQNA